MLRKLKLSFVLMLLTASVGCQSVSSVPHVPPTKTAGMDNGTARAELDAQDLIGIVIEGDQAIRQLNALHDWAKVNTK